MPKPYPAAGHLLYVLILPNITMFAKRKIKHNLFVCFVQVGKQPCEVSRYIALQPAMPNQRNCALLMPTCRTWPVRS